MASDQNSQTRDAVKREIKQIQARCVLSKNIIDNSPLEPPIETPEQENEAILSYISGLRLDVENPNTPIISDVNLLTSMFLTEIKDKTRQVEEMTAFVKGCIHDTEAENNRLKTLIAICQEARSRPCNRKKEVTSANLIKAKEKFMELKNELHYWMGTLFQNSESMVMDILGQLMKEHYSGESKGYIPITTETFKVIKLLHDINMVTVNPYNNMEVKLAF